MNQSPTVTTCDIDFSPLLNILRGDERGEGLRSEEIAAQWGCSQRRAVRLLGQAKKLGLVRVTRRKITDLSDRDTTVTAYVLEVMQ